MNTTQIDLIRQGETNAIKALYKSDFAQCASFILSNRGSRDDAKDLFQEAIMVLISNLRKEDFQLKCATGTYLYSIVRNLWFKHWNSKGVKNTDFILDNPGYHFVPVAEDEMEEKTVLEEKHELIAELLKKEMKEDCRKVILAFYYEKKSMEQIAKLMDYTAKFAKVKKNRCMGYLRKMVRERWTVDS